MTCAVRAVPVCGTGSFRPLSWVWVLLAALSSGALMACCFSPLNLHFLAWFAMVPWLLVLPRLPADKAFLYGVVVGIIYFGIGLAWLYQLHWLIGPSLIFWLAMLLGLSFRITNLLVHRFGAASMLWAAPAMFVGQEVLRSEMHGRFRFGFLAFGYSQSHDLWIAQTASLGGVYFITFPSGAMQRGYRLCLAAKNISRLRSRHRDWSWRCLPWMDFPAGRVRHIASRARRMRAVRMPRVYAI